MRGLIIQLAGQLASWGDIAIGELRPISDHPTKSAILGMFASALGIDREDEVGLQGVSQSFDLIFESWGNGKTVVDFHTVQTVKTRKSDEHTPPLNRRAAIQREGRPFQPKVTYRDYQMDAYWRVLVLPRQGAEVSLKTLQGALTRSSRPLYLGRRSCPLMLPLSPVLVEGESVMDLLKTKPPFHDLTNYPAKKGLARLFPRPWLLYWPVGIEAGVSPTQVIRRRDEPVSWTGRAYTYRDENVAVLAVSDG